jgi:hypothetical protein
MPLFKLSSEDKQEMPRKTEATSKFSKSIQRPAGKKDEAILYTKSPAAYRALSRKWRLPHKDTLLKSVRPIQKGMDYVWLI